VTDRLRPRPTPSRPGTRPTRATLLAFGALALAVVVALPIGPVTAQDASPSQPVACPSPTPPAIAPVDPISMPEDIRLAILDNVWQQLGEGYLDETMHGLDWDAVHRDFEERQLITFDAREAYQNVSDMVDLLEDPDTFFVSGLDLESGAIDPTYGGIGIQVGAPDAEDPSAGLPILYVFPGGPALAAGLQPRDVILAVDGDPCASPELIRGPVGTSVSLLVQAPGEEPRTVEVERQRIAPVYEVERSRVPGRRRYGYLRLVSMTDSTAEQLESALTELLDEGELGGLVLDLRHTNGGDLETTRRILGSFVGGEVATLRTREGDAPFVVEAGSLRDRLADIPVAVLVDEATDGEAERLAALLQAERDAAVVGVPTAGHTQIVTQSPLPDGSVLQMVVGGMLLADGTRVEGRGVIPDIVQEDDWLIQPAAEDVWVLTAVRELRRMSQGSAAAE
jgi:C-terminal peptidase prc